MENMYDILARLDQVDRKTLNESQALGEKITQDMTAGEVISDFVASDDPRFRGKSREERKKMALGAYYGMHPEKSRREDVEEARNPQELDYQEGPEDDAEYRAHHGIDDPVRQDDRSRLARDVKTLDRLERKALARAAQVDETDLDEVSRGEYIRQQDAQAERQGKKSFQAFGQDFSTDEVRESRTLEASAKKEKVLWPGTAAHKEKFGQDRETFRKKHAPSVMKDPEGRAELAKLDTEYEAGKKSYGRDEEGDDEEGDKKAPPTGEKRGRGRPKGSKRAIGAKGPSGKSKLLTREQAMAEGYSYLGRNKPLWSITQGKTRYVIYRAPGGVMAVRISSKGEEEPIFYVDIGGRELGGTFSSVEDAVYQIYNRLIGTPSNMRVKVPDAFLQKGYTQQQGVSEGSGDTHLQRLEYDVQQLADMGDYDAAEEHAALAPTADLKAHLRKIIRKAMMSPKSNDQSALKKNTRPSGLSVKQYAAQQMEDEYGDGDITFHRDRAGGYNVRHTDDAGGIHSHQYDPKTGKVDFRSVVSATEYYEGLAEDYDRDEYDEEGEMAKSFLRTIEDAAEELQSILSDEENLPEWVQKKITLAYDYLDTARDYMKANPPEAQGEIMPEGSTGDYSAKKARAGKDIGRPGKNFAKIAKSAGERYGSKERGEKVAGAVLAKLRAKEDVNEVDTGEADARKTVPAGKDQQDKVFARHRERVAKEKQDHEKEKPVKETTAGSVATAPAEGGKKSKGGIQFGKGVYESQLEESFRARLTAELAGTEPLTESVNVTMTVSATDEEAMALSQLMKMAGLFRSEGYRSACGSCGQMHEGACKMMEEDLANSADNTETMSTDYMVNDLAGGLNGPKQQVNPNNMADNPLAMKNLGKGPSGQINLGAIAEDIEQEDQQRLLDLYRKIS